jgi:hypothetical protein
MYFSDAAKALMLDAIDEGATGGADFGSLHSAYSTTGTNELTGGSPAYARKALTWAAAASGSKALAATLPTWDVPSGSTVAWIGLWDAVTVGTFLGMLPNNAGTLKQFGTMDDTNDTLYSEAHGYSNTQTVVVWGSNLPPGLAVGTVYYVRDAATDSFKLAATSGGAAIDLTDEGEGFVQSCTVETFGAQGTHSVTSLSVSLGAVA